MHERTDFLSLAFVGSFIRSVVSCLGGDVPSPVSVRVRHLLGVFVAAAVRPKRDGESGHWRRNHQRSGVLRKIPDCRWLPGTYTSMTGVCNQRVFIY